MISLCKMNAPLMMLGFYMDAINRRWSIHRCNLHMEIDSIVRYQMLQVNHMKMTLNEKTIPTDKQFNKLHSCKR